LSILKTLCLLVSSCADTKNLYLNNAQPLGKNNSKIHLGVGTGVMPKIDSIKVNTDEIVFSAKITVRPNLSISGQVGLGKNTDFRFAGHFPFLMGGFGLRAGIQHSLFDSSSKFNMALGFESEVVFSRKEVTIFKEKIETRSVSGGSYNADIYFPFIYQINPKTFVSVTPRYSLSGFKMRYFSNADRTYNFAINYPLVSLEIKYDNK